MRSTARDWIIGLIGAALIIAGAFLIAAWPEAVHATGTYTDGATSQWFQSLTVKNDSGANVGCCDQSDCHTTKATFTDGHWIAESVLYPGQKVVVPDNRVLKQGNPLMDAVICEASGYTSEFEVNTIPGGRADYVVCFVPPPQFT